ncbi:MAG: S8 family serine peptidase [Herpetosiphonaceae bacterium]|nr:S8 family serine peptidase [Herpetosiphonaceae bacterium]
MNALRSLWLCVFLSVACIIPATAQTPAATVIAHLEPGTTRSALQAGLAPGVRITGWLPQIRAAVLHLPPGSSANSIRHPKIRSIEQDAIMHPVASGPDPLFPQQYGLANVQASAAWTVSTGVGTVVAVVDSGIQLDHPDLASQLWANPGEIPGNGIDDDGDGYIDDVHGWHFYHGIDSFGNPVPQNDGDLSDGLGHGTHVSGIVGAARNNAEGGAGIAPDTRLMIMRVFGRPDAPYDANGYESDIASAILYTVDHGANVINMSLGGNTDVQALHDAIIFAVVHGVVVVAAAGNNVPAVVYPARYPEVIAVGATDRSDQPAFFSTSGPQLALSAPGVNILSTAKNPPPPNYPADDCPGSLMPPSTGYYGLCSGTSMSTPLVSGAAALLKSVHPAYTPACIRIVLEKSADDIAVPGFDPATGWGRLNAVRALQLASQGGCYTQLLPLVP